MTNEEKWEEYLKRICKNCFRVCEGDCVYANPNKQSFFDGLAEGRKEICKLCETKIKEKGKSCAYRSLGNEYCWEK